MGQQMTFIDNPKLATLEHARWATFPGISYLFDPHADCLSLDDATAFQYIDCNAQNNQKLALYAAMSDVLDKVGRIRLTNTFSLCTLPNASYHVTVLDGINIENVAELSEPAGKEFRELLDGFPVSFHRLCSFPRTFAIPGMTEWPIRLRFSHLEIRGNTALVARLKPADEDSLETFEQIKVHRHRFEEHWCHEYGKRNRMSEYAPHLSLGYFANTTCAASATNLLREWSEEAERMCGGQTIEFETISLYAFTDMATFFRVRREDMEA